ncbi:hypothetical protein [Enterococcus sp. AZ196]|uniref:hypothetical protein n=1 Tax=Enterococcus sp. AZ196 TaxID=2774659 RepID=UPI003D2D641C
MKYVFYSIGGYLESYEVIYFEKTEIIQITQEDLMHGINQTKSISVEFFDNILSNIEAITNSWEQEYINPEILDGTQWELLLSKHSKNVTDQLLKETDKSNEISGIKFFYGSNSYPDNFKQIEEYMEKLFIEK